MPLENFKDIFGFVTLTAGNWRENRAKLHHIGHFLDNTTQNDGDIQPTDGCLVVCNLGDQKRSHTIAFLRTLVPFFMQLVR